MEHSNPYSAPQAEVRDVVAKVRLGGRGERLGAVLIDALIISALMASFASLLFTWRGVRMVVNPVIRFWRGSPDAAGRP